MFDHVAIAVSDLWESKRFYSTILGVLGREPSYVDDDVMGWDDWWIGSTDDRHPLTRGLHVGFRARDRQQVDEFWWTAVDSGYREEGAPGPRTQYDPTYYSAFLLDPDGNSVQAVYRDRQPAVPTGCVDHLWIRVRDVQASMAFYAATALQTGLRLTPHDPDRLQLSGEDYSFWLVRDERRLTENLHVAFTSSDDDTVRGFHAAALAAGYEDNGLPGERPRYHDGYYAAFVLDPDGHNVEVVNHNLETTGMP
jgi:catechol 2,3-dioxygenase-like lactoylglutathione lyase family enzyme